MARLGVQHRLLLMLPGPSRRGHCVSVAHARPGPKRKSSLSLSLSPRPRPSSASGVRRSLRPWAAAGARRSQQVGEMPRRP